MQELLNRKFLIVYFILYLTYIVYSQKSCNSEPAKCKDMKYRTINGSCNNLNITYLGKAFRPYARVTPNNYADGVHKMPLQTSGNPLPSARYISNILLPEGDGLDKKYTVILMQMGQIITHDMSLSADTLPSQATVPEGCCTNRRFGPNSDTENCSDINIPSDDPDFSSGGFQCLSFSRAATTKKYGCPVGPYEEQISIVTAYLDQSLTYGSSEETSNSLRTFRGGRLKTVQRDGREWPESTPNVTTSCFAKSEDEVCFVVGDDRVNQNPQLTTLQIAFYLEHNRITDSLKKINPHWSDEKLFQEGRRINIAEYQHIVYNEILPGYLGYEHMIKKKLLYPKAKDCVDDYDQDQDPSVMQEFAMGAWRFFHTLIMGNLKLYNKKRKNVGDIVLSDWLVRPQVQLFNSTVNIDTLIRGMTIQHQARSDNIEDSDIKSRLFKDSTTGLGTDLIAIDIQRSRDHGLGTYKNVREWCGLSVAKTWKDMEKDIPRDKVKKLKKVYESPDDVELLPGAAFERHVTGSLAGPTFLCILTAQFLNSRTSDRFFYENCEKSGFTNEQLKSIRKITLAKVLCDNSDVCDLQKRVTREPGKKNRITSCDKLPGVDLKLWEEKDCSKQKEKPVDPDVGTESPKNYKKSKNYVKTIAIGPWVIATSSLFPLFQNNSFPGVKANVVVNLYP